MTTHKLLDFSIGVSIFSPLYPVLSALAITAEVVLVFKVRRFSKITRAGIKLDNLPCTDHTYLV